MIASLFSAVKSSFNSNANYLVHGRGDSSILISAPHGGSKKPFAFRTRKYGKVLKDTYTKEITQYIINSQKLKPYYIYSELHRSKLDLNRDMEEACQGSKVAEAIWYDWNEIITSYLKEIVDTYGKALYIDLHSHSGSSFELGYGLSARDYRSICRGGGKYKNTLRAFGENDYNLICGTGSFAHTLQDFGFEVLYPTNDAEYFNGGRNIQVFSSDSVGSIQIEVPTIYCRKNFNLVCRALEESIVKFEEELVK